MNKLYSFFIVTVIIFGIFSTFTTKTEAAFSSKFTDMTGAIQACDYKFGSSLYSYIDVTWYIPYSEYLSRPYYVYRSLSPNAFITGSPLPVIGTYNSPSDWIVAGKPSKVIIFNALGETMGYVDDNITAGTKYYYQTVVTKADGSFLPAINEVSVTPIANKCIGNINVKAFLDGNPWTGNVIGKINGDFLTLNFTSTPSTFSNIFNGLYNGNYISGNPPNALIDGSNPPFFTPSNILNGNGSTITFNIYFKSLTGHIGVRATLDGIPWTGPVNYTLSGPETISGMSVNTDFTYTKIGNYILNYNSGGPPGATFQSVTPNSAQIVQEDQWTFFNLNFVSPNLTLTVSNPGSGGRVNSSDGFISCGNGASACSHSYPPNPPFGTPVILTTTPNTGAGYTNGNWGGDCGIGSNASQCSFTMNANKSVSATFNLNEYSLTVEKSGNGSGLVTSSPTGIICGIDCSESYPSGTQVTLTASPNPGSIFTGWSGGGCSGTGTCTVLVNSTKIITAAFNTPPGDIQVNAKKDGAPWTGSVNYTLSGPETISGTSVSQTFLNKLTGSYTLTYNSGGPASAVLSSISPASSQVLSSGSTIVFTMDFITSGAGTHTLTVTNPGSQGKVISSDGFINCGNGSSSCSHSYTSGASVTLNASPSFGYTNGNWGGDCGTGSNASSCSLTMNANKSVSATFNVSASNYTLTVTNPGSSGRITSWDGFISCGAGTNDCSYSYSSGASVVLNAIPAGSYTNGNWGGACGTGSNASACFLTMNTDKSVSATFTFVAPPLTAACSVSPTTINSGGSATWSATPSGGSGSYTYSWSGTDGLSGNSQSVTKPYSSSGTKTGQVTVSDGAKSVSAPCSNFLTVSSVALGCTLVASPSSGNAPLGVNFSIIDGPITHSMHRILSGTGWDSGNILAHTANYNYTTPGSYTATAELKSNCLFGICLSTPGSCTTNVNVTSVAMTPTFVIVDSSGDSNATIGIGQTEQYFGIYDPDGPSGPLPNQYVPNTSVSWNSGNVLVASMTIFGIATGEGLGSVQIEGTYSSITATANLTVSNTCVNDCPVSGATACQGNGVITCGNYDADSCLEWSSQSPCPAGQSCIGGTCVSSGTSPNIIFGALPTTIKQGESVNINWTTANVDSCQASEGYQGDWTGSKPLSGQETVFPKRTSNYTLTCLNFATGQSVSKSVTITVRVIPDIHPK